MNNPAEHALASTPVPVSSGPALPLRVVVMLLLAIAAAMAASTLKPSKRLAEIKPRIDLETQLPKSFGRWRQDPSIRPVLPDPSLQSMLDALYTQTLSRTYINDAGQRVMLSIAYGSDQSSEATAVHRPEFCYSAQGYAVQDVGESTLDLGDRKVIGRHLIARYGRVTEPITYWVTLDERTTLPGLGRRLEQIRFGLRGEIADGLLFRLSSWSDKPEAAYELHRRFVQEMKDHVPAEVRARYFGS